jgi:molybdenum cofactor cytidylyltransferase
MPRIGVVILAAGAATRMGEVKQCLPFRNRSLLRHTSEEALASGCDPVVVVLGAHAELAGNEIRGLPIQVVVNPDWSEGMGTSIRCGMHALTAHPGPDEVAAVVVTVCDQPFFSAGIIRALISAQQESGKPIAAAAYEDTRGVPVLFSRAFFPELMALPASQGARKVILARAEETVGVPFPEGAFDLDTPEDYARLSAMTDCASGSARRADS